jgi:MFS transporter, DHA1 family, multidrug resistance protein
VALCFPTAPVNNFAAFLVLRFLQVFFGSPCLATGGASLADLQSLLKLPYSLTVWAAFAACGPAMGPILSGFSVPTKNWHWSLWEILWIARPIFIILMLFLPETSSSNILLRRAARLRKLTGNPDLRSQAELDQSKISVSIIAYESPFRPWQLIFLDPAVLFTNLYTVLVYCIYYSFFEAFPIVYISFYGFNLGKMGLTFLSITVSVCLAFPCYYAYIYYLVELEIKKNGIGALEGSLIPALFVSFFLPIGLFMFGAYKSFTFILEGRGRDVLVAYSLC